MDSNEPLLSAYEDDATLERVDEEVDNGGDGNSSVVRDHNKLTKFLISHHKRVGLFANLMLAFGFTLLLCFEIYDIQDRAREAVAIVLYFLSFSILTLSGMIELAIDIYCVRTMGSGRYYSNSAKWNRCISLIFLAALILDIVAVALWLRFLFDAENVCLLCSSYLYLVMSMVALYFQIRDMQVKNWIVDLPNRINFIGNFVVVIFAVLRLVSRHMVYSDQDFESTINFIGLVTIPGWLFSAILYVTADLCRIYS